MRPSRTPCCDLVSAAFQPALLMRLPAQGVVQVIDQVLLPVAVNGTGAGAGAAPAASPPVPPPPAASG